MNTADYNILIIEDGEDLRNTLYDLLDMSGYNVRTASNGLDGYESIVNHPPHLVVCDVNMPEMNGYEVLEKLNANHTTGLKPIFLFLTARVQFEDVKRGLDLGADDYITKPFDTSELLNSIRQRLETRDKLINHDRH